MGSVLFWKNPKWSLISQLQLSTGLLAFISQLIALILLVSLTFQMCSQAKTMAKNSLEDQILDNAEVTANQTALVVDQSLKIIVNSVLLAINRGLEFSHEYSSNLHLIAEETLWTDEISPTSTSRLGESVSLDHDSFEMVEVTYDSSTPDVNQLSADGRTFTIHDSSFADTGSPARIQQFFNRSSHLTRLMKFAYEQWSSIAAIYIGSDFGQFACPFGYSQSDCDNNYNYGSSHYHTFRRYPGQTNEVSYIKYPGITTHVDVPYDPTLRPWYIAANSTAWNYHLDGPYQDATTNKWMITFAKKEEETEETPRSVVGVDILLTDLQSLVSTLSIGQSGFAVLLLYPRSSISECAMDGQSCTCENGLVKYGNNLIGWSDWRRPNGASIGCSKGNFGISTDGSNRMCMCEPEPFVLVYGSNTIDQVTHLSDIDLNLLQSDFTLLRANAHSGSFRYSNSQSETYLGGFGIALEGNVVIVTLSPESEALATVEILEDDISKTESTISILVILCAVAALIISMIFVYKTSKEISQPLVDISENCKIIMDAQTKEDKEFQPKKITVFGNDSLNELAKKFVTLMKGMHDAEARKKAEPKYPSNPYWVGLQNMQAPWRVHPLSRYMSPSST